jgi:hypothetical protein
MTRASQMKDDWKLAAGRLTVRLAVCWYNDIVNK